MAGEADLLRDDPWCSSLGRNGESIISPTGEESNAKSKYGLLRRYSPEQKDATLGITSSHSAASLALVLGILSFCDKEK